MAFEPKKISLRSPLIHGDTTITELVFSREMCAGDLRGDINVGMPTYDDCRTVASRITGVPLPILANLIWHDFSEVIGVIMGFFNDTPQTGERA